MPDIRPVDARPDLAGLLRRERFVAVLRAPRYGDPEGSVRALVDAGIRVIELTMTADNALEALTACRSIDGAVIGIGSVTDEAAAQAAVAAGADFIVSPVGPPELPGAVDVPVVLAGQTPDELWRAQRATGGPVKLFPADLGGPRYLRAVLAPLPQLEVMPSGGIELDDVDAWLTAGAIAVSLGSSLCPPGALERGDSGPITERASRLNSLVRA